MDRYSNSTNMNAEGQGGATQGHRLPGLYYNRNNAFNTQSMLELEKTSIYSSYNHIMTENMYLFIHLSDFIELPECARHYLKSWRRD